MMELIKNIATVTAGNSAPTKEEFSKEGIPFVRAGSLEFLVRGVSINECEKINEEVAKEKRLRVFPKGSILFAKSGMSAKMGRIYVLSEDAYVVSHLAVISVTSEKANNRYLAYYFNYRPPVNLIKDDAYPSISITDIENVEIPLPDLETQNKIVAILDKAKAILDKREETIKKYDDLLRATFLEMFGDPVKNEKGFRTGTIRDVVREVKYGTSKAAEVEGEYPYLRMNNISFEGYMDYTDLKYINIPKKEREKYIVRDGDLLFNRTNSKELVGKTGIFDKDKEMVIAGYLIRVRTNELANTYYLWGYLNSKHGKQTLFSMCKNIVGMANINAQELQDIKILIPPIELQNRYKAVFLKVMDAVTQLNESKEKILELNAALSQLSFKGELEFNTAVDLEVLLENDYQFFKENSSSKSIQLLLERLNTDELNENKFYEQQTYDKAKRFVFELIKEGKVKQVFDEKTKKVNLTV